MLQHEQTNGLEESKQQVETTRKSKIYAVFTCLLTVVILSLMVVSIVVLSHSKTNDSDNEVHELNASKYVASLKNGEQQHSPQAGVRVPAQFCPIKVSNCKEFQYFKGVGIESWKTKSNIPAKEVATELLEELREQRFSLIKADYLGIYGDSWGCTVKSSEDEAYVISLMSNDSEANASGEYELNINIVHILKPAQEPQPTKH